jgi:tetratricopeptide (TPR) repeat protein
MTFFKKILLLFRLLIVLPQSFYGIRNKRAAANAFSLAETKAAQLDYPAAQSYYSQAVQLAPYNSLYLNELAVLLHSLGEYSAAEPLYKRALAIDEKVFGKKHPHVASELNNLADLYRAQGKYAEAESLFKQALAIDEKVFGKKHLKVAIALNNLAALYDTQGKYVEAELLYQRALGIFENVLGQEHPNTQTVRENLQALQTKIVGQ